MSSRNGTRWMLLVALVLSGRVGAAQPAPPPESALRGLDFVTVWRARDAMLAAHPDDPLAWAVVGRAWLEGAPAPDPARAEAHCRRALAPGGETWKRAEGHLCVALARRATGDLAGAAEACAEAARTSPRSRARREADLVLATLSMPVVVTAHLEVRAPADSAVAAGLRAWADRREQAAARARQALGVTPWRRIRVVVCDDEAQGQRALGHGLGYTDRMSAVVFSRSDQSPGHEIAHAMSLFLLPGRPWGGGPDADAGRGRLINEGLAVALDDTGRDLAGEARAVLAGLGRAPSFAEMDRAATPEETLYPLAGAFVAALRQRYGAAAFAAFWRHPGDGDQAAAAVYGTTTEQLWGAWVRSVQGPGG